jgi:hypothetical protein
LYALRRLWLGGILTKIHVLHPGLSSNGRCHRLLIDEAQTNQDRTQGLPRPLLFAHGGLQLRLVNETGFD